MKSNSLVYKKSVYLTFFTILCCLIYSSTVGIALGQKKPKTLKMDVDSDDKQLCDASLNGNRMNLSQFCDYYRAYNAQGASADAKKAARNEMIDLVRGQVDIYYKQRKDSRGNQVKWLQMLFDVLEVGSSTAIAIINGERDKTVIGAALSGFQSGRTAFNRNFEVLQTQTLINKMNENRAEIMTEIVRSKNNTVSDYSWYAAKADLRRYLFAGTFSNALDSLVEETGSEAEQAERNLARIEKRPILQPLSDEATASAKSSFDVMTDLDKALKGTEAQKTSATKALRNVVANIITNPKIEAKLKTKKITVESEGAAIFKALEEMIAEFDDAGDEATVRVIESGIINFGKIGE
jgi:hypothetical protein